MAEHMQNWGQKNKDQAQVGGFGRMKKPRLQKREAWNSPQESIRAERNRGGEPAKKKEKSSPPCDGSRCCPRNPGGPFRSRAITDVRVGDAEMSCDDLVLLSDSENITSVSSPSPLAVWKGVLSQTGGHASTFGSRSAVIRFLASHVAVTSRSLYFKSEFFNFFFEKFEKSP